MRWPLLWVEYLLFAARSVATPVVRIQEVGLGAYFYNEPTPTPVGFLVTNPGSQAQTIELLCKLITPRTQYSPGRVDTSTYKLSLAPLEQDEAEVPVLLSWSEGYARPRAGARGTLPQTPFAGII